MKKLMFIFLGLFTLAAFTGFNEEDLNALSSNLEQAKQEQDDIEEDLCEAVKNGDYDTFFDLYPKSPNKAKTICDINGKKEPIIIVAAKYSDDNTDILFNLIHFSNINVETRDENDYTPLMWAVSRGNIENAKYLIEECGANVNAKNKFGKDILFQTSNQEMIALLKKHGAIDSEQEAQKAQNEARYKELVKKLEENKTYRGTPDDYDNMSYSEVSSIMKEIRNLGYQIPTKLFHKYRDNGEVKYATKKNATDYLSEYEPFPTILFEALSCISIADSVGTLLKKGADANKRNALNETPLIAFFRYNYTATYQYHCMSYPEGKEEAKKIIRLLIQYGDVNARDNRGCTALGYAAGMQNCPRSGHRLSKGQGTEPVRAPQDIINLLTSNGARY